VQKEKDESRPSHSDATGVEALFIALAKRFQSSAEKCKLFAFVVGMAQWRTSPKRRASTNSALTEESSLNFLLFYKRTEGP